MRKSTLFILTLTLFVNAKTYSQAVNFQAGKKAYQENEYGPAIKHLTKAVNEEKFEMKGKDLSLAYAYLASIKLKYLESNINTNDPNTIKQGYGNITSIFEDLNNAVKFQSKATVEINDYSTKTIKKIILSSCITLAIPLVDFGKKQYSKEEIHHAELIIKLLTSLSSSQTDDFNWIVSDLIGISQYIIGDKKNGILALDKARENSVPGNDLTNNTIHLKNHLISRDYYYKEQIDLIKTRAICESGIQLVKEIVASLGENDFNVIKKYTILDNKFYSTISRLDE